jgi:hypothetical protein
LPLASAGPLMAVAALAGPRAEARNWLLPGAAVVAALAGGFVFLVFSGRFLPDTDSYYHLALAREMATHPVLRDLPQVRFSALHVAFGDQAWLFHLLLAPFGRWAGLPDPRVAGAAGLAFMLALLAGVLAYLGGRLAGPWGLALPLLLAFSASETTGRFVRLRPELLALTLFLLILWVAAQRRYRTLAGLSFVYTLSYTAFHALLGLFVLVVLFRGVLRRSWEWKLLGAVALGVGLGIVVHPNFPANLTIWTLQLRVPLRAIANLEVGSEFVAEPASDLLLANLAWFAAITLLWCSPRRAGAVAAAADDELVARGADLFGIAALAFGGLYLLAVRFSTYVYPFCTLWTLCELRRRGKVPGAWLVVAGRRVPMAVALVACVLVGLPAALRRVGEVRAVSDPQPRASLIADRAAVSRALPDGARVAAPWQVTPIYLFWAPQALYLNVLDPVAMAIPFPREFAVESAVFAGAEPDVPLAVDQQLASDYVACNAAGPTAAVVARLAADPRARALYTGRDAVFALLPGANQDFVTVWREALSGRPYPRLPPGQGGELEGYVDAGRLGGTGCVALVHDEQTATEQVVYEFAPSGPAQLALDDRIVIAVTEPLHAFLGRGVLLPLRLGAGLHRLTVTTCPDDGPAPRTGFYLLARQRRPG